MKTAISIPDEVFEAAERTAKSLGVSRSELYATAVREYLERYRREGLTEKLNQVYENDEAASELDERLRTLQLSSLEKEPW